MRNHKQPLFIMLLGIFLITTSRANNLDLYVPLLTSAGVAYILYEDTTNLIKKMNMLAASDTTSAQSDWYNKRIKKYQKYQNTIVPLALMLGMQALIEGYRSSAAVQSDQLARAFSSISSVS